MESDDECYTRAVRNADDMVMFAEWADREYHTSSIAERTRLLVRHLESRDFDGCETCPVIGKCVGFQWCILRDGSPFSEYDCCALVISADDDRGDHYFCSHPGQRAPGKPGITQTSDPRTAVNNLRDMLIEHGVRKAEEREGAVKR